jgi:hypothetical protein
MRAVFRFSRGAVFVVAAACLTLGLPRVAPAAASPRLAAAPTDGLAPILVAFDTTRSALDGTLAEHLLLVGNGDVLPLATVSELPNYGYQLPGFYLAQTWLRGDTGLGASTPVAIRVGRVRDGLMPPTADVVLAHTTDPLTFAFMPTITPAEGDEIVARRWDFGDGTTSPEEAPLHMYPAPGVYQAMLVVTSRAGLTAWGRTLVAVTDAGGAVGPSLLVAVSPQDASALTPVRVTARVEGAAGVMVMRADVAWPDIDDASPMVTDTAAGVQISSEHGFAAPGYYDVPVTVLLAGQTTPLTAVAHVVVAGFDGSPPSPAVWMVPSREATVGKAYAPNGEGAASAALLVGGAGPFAFGAAAPSPSGFTVDDVGRLTWTPASDQVGRQRLAVRIVDADAHETVYDWVVDVKPASGCAVAGAGHGDAAAVALLGCALAWLCRRRRYGATSRQVP